MDYNQRQAALIVGASSGLGRSLAHTLAAQGHHLVIAARNERDLSAIAADLIIRYKVQVKVVVLNIAELDIVAGERFASSCFELFSNLNQVYITAGMVSDNDFGPESAAEVRQLHDVNYAGITCLLGPLCQRLCQVKSNITVISTIAAIRPRSRNLAYGAAKVALEYYVAGLQHFYADQCIRLQIYRVGYMQTAMSAGKKLLLPVADPDKVAGYIFRNRNKPFRMRYYPRFWALIALPVKLLPWFVYKKLKH